MADDIAAPPPAPKPKRPRGNPLWVKGQASPNPGGRHKDCAHVAEIARTYTAEAIETLVRLMRESIKEEVRARCAEALLDRGYGRPAQAQAIEISGSLSAGPLAGLSTEQLIALARIPDAPN